MSTDQPTPDQAYRFCRNVTRCRARNFYYGLKLTPQPQRSALYAVYAWMRRADDLVDNAPKITDNLRREIATFRGTTDAALSGRVTENEHLWVALADTAGRYDLPHEAFHLTLEGQLDDLAGAHYATFGDVRDYCYRVASTLRDPLARGGRRPRRLHRPSKTGQGLQRVSETQGASCVAIPPGRG